MKTSLSVGNIIKARIEAKKILSKPKKDGVNPHFRSKYITYESLIKSIEDAMLPNGLDMYTELVNGEDGSVGCKITLYHISGEYITSNPFFLPCAQKTAQGYGSASTYVLRYAVAAFWGLAAEEDDDGNSATPKPVNTVKKGQGEGPSWNKAENYKPGVINKIKEEFKKKEVPEDERDAWLKSHYGVDQLEKLNLTDLNKLLAKVVNKNVGNNQTSGT